MRQFPPSRIVCLTEETVETLYLLGEFEPDFFRPSSVDRCRSDSSGHRRDAFNQRDIPGILAMLRISPGSDLTDEQAKKWEKLLNDKGRVPFIEYPNLCVKCGTRR
jgi:hypothetical protein